MSLTKPVPLYPPYIDLCEFDLEDYPELAKIFLITNLGGLNNLIGENYFLFILVVINLLIHMTDLEMTLNVFFCGHLSLNKNP